MSASSAPVGEYAEAGAVLLEGIVAGQAFARFRGAAGAAIGAILAKTETPDSDLIVEAKAEAAFDAWEILAGISCSVVLVAGEADRFFPSPSFSRLPHGLGCHSGHIPGSRAHGSLHGQSASQRCRGVAA
ncbi:hypothetical protein [Brevibacterium yomogidense]|uniref:hypothetical protein n=1 Tax=Brevibacterium yomogidense TaxID=946573 RepID=UPI001178BE24|nr:hypothetical protein [Brevibacterium yomogidense]